MALIKNMTKITKNCRIHDEVECTYTINNDYNKKILQIDTYGSPNRKVKGKVSQSIQLDIEGAKKLHKILEDFINLH